MLRMVCMLSIVGIVFCRTVSGDTYVASSPALTGLLDRCCSARPATSSTNAPFYGSSSSSISGGDVCSRVDYSDRLVPGCREGGRSVHLVDGRSGSDEDEDLLNVTERRCLVPLDVGDCRCRSLEIAEQTRRPFTRQRTFHSPRTFI